jgi:glucan biosynthesis protein C
LVLGSVVTFVTLLPMQKPALDTETSFLVAPKILLAYGVFVGFGWVLYLNRDQVDGFARRAWAYIAAGFLLSCAYLAYILLSNGAMMAAGKALAAASMWTLIYGFIGLFVRYYDHPRPLGRYLADASYWLYLVHLPLTVWVPGLMNGWNAPAVLKAAITFGVTATVCVVTYHYFVRSTAIGALLNGKRFPRGLPELRERAPQAAAQTA